MKFVIAGILFIGSTAFAFPQTDYTCVNKCTAQGMSYGLCNSQCTYDPMPNNGQGSYQIKQTDYQCVSRCTSQGSLYSFCKSKCEY